MQEGWLVMSERYLMTSNFCAALVLSLRKKKILKMLRYLPFVFKLIYNGEEKTTIRAVMLFHQGNLDRSKIYYCTIKRSLSVVTVITFIGAIETKKWSLNLIPATVLAPYIEWRMKPPLWLEKRFLDTDKACKG